MNDKYKVPERAGKAIFKEKMSKFIAFSSPVQSAEEARSFIKSIQNEYHDARHVCWAYMIGPMRTEWQLNDNGEPSGTAGKPILGQINSLGLTNVVVAIVRYFGGIKLGTSGLTAAYREAARLALQEGGFKELRQMQQIEITFPYISLNDVMKLIKQTPINVLNQTFDNTCRISAEIPVDDASSVLPRLLSIDGVTKAL